MESKSIRQKVFQFLAKNPHSELKNLYENEEFKGENYSTLKVYLHQFREKYKDFLKYDLFRTKSNQKNRKIIEYSTIYSIFEMYPIIPAFLFYKVYHLTKGSKEIDYSVVDIYDDLFERILSGNFNDEISDFSLNIYSELKNIYNDMNLEQVNIHVIIYEAVKLIEEIHMIIHKIVFDNSGNLISFRKKEEKIECMNQVKNFIKAKILSHLFTELYIKAEHLRTRNTKYIYRDYLKLGLKLRKGETIRVETTEKKMESFGQVKVFVCFKDHFLGRYFEKGFLKTYNKAVSEYKDNNPILIDYAFNEDEFDERRRPSYCKNLFLESNNGRE